MAKRQKPEWVINKEPNPVTGQAHPGPAPERMPRESDGSWDVRFIRWDRDRDGWRRGYFSHANMNDFTEEELEFNRKYSGHSKYGVTIGTMRYPNDAGSEDDMSDENGSAETDSE